MGRYLLRRVAYLVPIWLGISLVAFALASATPGDPTRIELQERLGRQPTAAEVATDRARLGLDDPFPVRYGRWVANAAVGDLGTSYRTGEPIRAALLRFVPPTLQIALLGLGAALAVSLPLGIMAAVWRNSPIDHLTRIVALVGASMPSYWLGYLLILCFAVRLGWLPVAGRGTWQHAVMPAATLGLGGAATLMRLTRSELLETLGQDFVRTGRAKGLGEARVVVGHALRNALIPVTTMAGIQFAGLLGGAVIVETVFAWPGVGKYVVDAITARDYPVIQGFVVFAGTAFLLVNLAVDVAYVWLDPRIGFGRG